MEPMQEGSIQSLLFSFFEPLNTMVSWWFPNHVPLVWLLWFFRLDPNHILFFHSIMFPFHSKPDNNKNTLNHFLLIHVGLWPLNQPIFDIPERMVLWVFVFRNKTNDIRHEWGKEWKWTSFVLFMFFVQNNQIVLFGSKQQGTLNTMKHEHNILTRRMKRGMDDDESKDGCLKGKSKKPLFHEFWLFGHVLKRRWLERDALIQTSILSLCCSRSNPLHSIPFHPCFPFLIPCLSFSSWSLLLLFPFILLSLSLSFGFKNKTTTPFIHPIFAFLAFPCSLFWWNTPIHPISCFFLFLSRVLFCLSSFFLSSSLCSCSFDMPCFSSFC